MTLYRLVPFLVTAVSGFLPAMAQEVIAQKDVIYGRADGAALLADIAYPAGKDHLPVILMVHGGRWRAGSKSDETYAKQDGWARYGFFAMNIDYRLVNSTPAPACYQDMYTAIRWVHAHASEYHIDTSRIYLMVTLQADTKSLSPPRWARGRMEKRADGTKNPRISVQPSASPEPTI